MIFIETQVFKKMMGELKRKDLNLFRASKRTMEKFEYDLTNPPFKARNGLNFEYIEQYKCYSIRVNDAWRILLDEVKDGYAYIAIGKHPY